MTSLQNRFLQLKPIYLPITVFVISRLLLLLQGVRFGFEHISSMMQIIDLDLLRSRMMESVFYMHSQPPIFNLFVGTVLVAFPDGYPLVFKAVYLLMGLALTLSTYVLMRQVGVSGNLSAILTSIFIIGPSVIAYENFLYYTYPLAILLSFAAVFMHSYVKYERLRDLFVSFFCVALVALTRSLYHLLWVLAILAILVAYKPKNLRKILVVCAVPLLLVSALYVKNFILLGIYTSSSFSGFELARRTTFLLPVPERVSLVKSGHLSYLSLVGVYSPASTYKKFIKTNVTGISILDNEYTSLGDNNYNNLVYLLASKRYHQDAIYVLLHYPQLYVDSLNRAIFIAVMPGPCKWPGEGNVIENMKRIPEYEDIYNTIVFWQILPHTDAWTTQLRHGLYEQRVSLFWMVGAPALMLYTLWYFVSQWKNPNRDHATFVTMVFMWFCVAYLITGSVLASEWGINRYRFPIESFIAVFIGFFMTSLQNRPPRIKRLQAQASNQSDRI